MADSITLKWGTLKAWNLTSNTEAQEILQRYLSLGTSMSAMAQHDTTEQKELLCALIKVHKGNIYNDWSGETYTTEQAIEYILNYGIS